MVSMVKIIVLSVMMALFNGCGKSSQKGRPAVDNPNSAQYFNKFISSRDGTLIDGPLKSVSYNNYSGLEFNNGLDYSQRNQTFALILDTNHTGFFVTWDDFNIIYSGGGGIESRIPLKKKISFTWSAVEDPKISGSQTLKLGDIGYARNSMTNTRYLNNALISGYNLTNGLNSNTYYNNNYNNNPLVGSNMVNNDNCLAVVFEKSISLDNSDNKIFTGTDYAEIGVSEYPIFFCK